MSQPLKVIFETKESTYFIKREIKNFLSLPDWSPSAPNVSVNQSFFIVFVQKKAPARFLRFRTEF
jgi:hypothetical protein